MSGPPPQMLLIRQLLQTSNIRLTQKHSINNNSNFKSTCLHIIQLNITYITLLVSSYKLIQTNDIFTFHINLHIISIYFTGNYNIFYYYVYTCALMTFLKKDKGINLRVNRQQYPNIICDDTLTIFNAATF